MTGAARSISARARRRVVAIAHVPVWAFHGAKDQVVPLRTGQEMVDALNAAGGTRSSPSIPRPATTR